MSTQQQQQGNSSSTKNCCVITNADSYVGFALAYRFLRSMQHLSSAAAAGQQGGGDVPELQGQKLCLLVSQRHESGIGLKRLEEMGAEICEVDYKDEEKLRHHLKNVRSIILIPENSSDRVEEAENVLNACKHQGVEHVGMISIVGVDRIHKSGQQQQQQNQQDPFANNRKIGEYCNLKEFCEIEKMVKECFSGNKHCIVRAQLFYQLFYFMAPQIENDNMVCLPVKRGSKWGLVNLVDVVEGIFHLAKKHHQEGRNNTGKNCWEFTAPKTWSGEEMAREIGEGLGREDMKYKEISCEEFQKHMEKIKQDKRFKERLSTHEKGDFKQGRDGWWSFPVVQFINQYKMELIMEYFCLACKGQLDYHTDDLKKALERNPHTLKDYFKVNRECFKKFK